MDIVRMDKDSMDSREQFYKKLKKKLKKDTQFPARYMFKFIVPTDEERIKQVEELFDHTGAVIDKKESRTGKYTSVSIQVIMKKADHIIHKYQQAEKIEGIISL